MSDSKQKVIDSLNDTLRILDEARATINPDAPDYAEISARADSIRAQIVQLRDTYGQPVVSELDALKSVDDVVKWVRSHAEKPKVTDYLEGYAMGQVESLTKAGAKKIEFKLIFEETKRNNGQTAGYMLLLQTHVDGNETPTRAHVIYYLVNQDGKIIGYLIPPR
jgi:hypothetical protein